jgi:hypothetical protein
MKQKIRFLVLQVVGNSGKKCFFLLRFLAASCFAKFSSIKKALS